MPRILLHTLPSFVPFHTLHNFTASQKHCEENKKLTKMKFHPDSLPNLTGKVYVVTGGTSGMYDTCLFLPSSLFLIPSNSPLNRGYNTVARLAQHGANVYLGARNLAKGTQAIKEIKTLYPQANLTLLEMDHLSLSSVVSAATLLLSRESAIHGLINNAGIMATPLEMTKDGYEAQFQTNHLAHWVLVSYLLPLMLDTSKSLPPGSVRIVNLSSVGHWSAPKGGINFSDTSLAGQANMARYGQSKLANVLHIKTLHKLYGPDSPSAKAGKGEIWAAAVHPGCRLLDELPFLHSKRVFYGLRPGGISDA